MFKNPTPRGLAFFAAFIAAFFTAICTALFRSHLWEVVVCTSVVFTTSFIAFFYSLEYFIYRKIKLVYKNIHYLKTEKNTIRNSATLKSGDPIANVSTEVMEWAQDKASEIEQLKKMENYRKDFLGNVSHELKTPLFAIQGYTDTLLDSDLDDPDLIRHFLKKAAVNSDRLADLIEDLEAISQLESGELTMQMETFDVHDLVGDVFDSIEFKAAEKGIELSFKEGSDRPYIVEADKNRIRQVITNLLVNSIKYGNKDGFTKVGLYDMDENILVEVTDSGIGVDAEHLPRLFERFYRVDRSRSREEGGTGLGLSIVKHIIEAHNQSINVRSKPGLGTTFGFTLAKA